jgi:hypothetical protein
MQTDDDQHDDHVWLWRMWDVARWERARGLAAFLD